MYPIVSHALAKVNLLLNITGKADDGYHKMQSIFAFLKDLYDELIFYPDKEFNEYSALIPGIEHNQITKAWHILKNHFTRHIPHLEIAKNIPICAGLGGGSSDAACFINSVFDFWKFSKQEKLSYIDIFRPLGADTRVFLFKYFTNCRFVYLNGTGIDGEIREINLPVGTQYMLIINDGTKLSTKDVFKNLKEPFCKNIESFESIKENFQLNNFHNSLQNSALELAPQLRVILCNLLKMSPIAYGISGSGATCFAVVSKVPSSFSALSYKFKTTSVF